MIGDGTAVHIEGEYLFAHPAARHKYLLSSLSSLHLFIFSSFHLRMKHAKIDINKLQFQSKSALYL